MPPKYALRAAALAEKYPASAEILNFYARLARFVEGVPEWARVVEWAKSNANPELAATLEQEDNPFARAFALSQARHEPKVTEPWPNFCACCGAAPGAAVLRPEADGSRRSLVCSRCGHEWLYQRILCTQCQEQRFEELPVYIAEEFPHLRVECCATCKHYLIAADLVKEPEAVPLVEDIAALPLHLWATGQGYSKAALNIFGY